MKPLRLWLLASIVAVFTIAACSMKPQAYAEPFTVQSDLALLREPGVLPRNINLKAFEPHRKSFECRHEAEHVPPIDAQAEALFQQGLALTSMDLWPNQRNYPLAVKLWQQAADKGHWKAMMNLAGVLIEGDGTEPYVVPADSERAVSIVEEAMRLGIPAAFDAMGSYHRQGFVDGDDSRAYAFWELAADMGSPSAQTHIGKSLLATYDYPKEGWWANREIGLQMLECAFAQGYGPAAYELGLELDVIAKDYPRALRILHEGVKMGSERCANYLASSFDGIDPLTNNFIDTARSERYSELGDALWRNPDLRFPNLDKILPLPPAPLPQWGDSLEILKDAAKPLVPVPVQPPSPGASLSGRAHIPAGHALVLPARVQLRNEPAVSWDLSPGLSVTQTGYWQVRLEPHEGMSAEQIEVMNRINATPPMHYRYGERFEPVVKWGEITQYQRANALHWVYLGTAVPQPERPPHPKVAQGVARYTELPEPPLLSTGGQTCPRTGIWAAWVDAKHPRAKVFNNMLQRQAYVSQGQAFSGQFTDHPAPALGIAAADVHWRWLGHANPQDGNGQSRVEVQYVQPKKAGQA